jgi:anti-anti-sigma factor
VEEVVIDLSQVAFLDSAALGLLMISHRQLGRKTQALAGLSSADGSPDHRTGEFAQDDPDDRVRRVEPGQEKRIRPRLSPGEEPCMQITERRIGQSIILDLTGELSYANRTTFKAAVERSKRAGCRHLILNMQGVRFLDSSALGTLALLAQSFPATQGMVSLLNPQSYVKEIITLANLHQILPVYTSEQDALAGSRLPAAG